MEQKKRAKFVNSKKTQFLKTLKQRVDQYFEEHHVDKKANPSMIFKSIVLLSLYALPIVALYMFQLPNWAVIICYSLTGFGVAGVGMGVMHDANHGAYSNNKTVNRLMGYSLNLMGGFDVNWRHQHNILHHTYTNIAHMDEDIDQRLKMRWSPHFKFHPVQRFQHIYAFLAYCLSTVSWILMKDYKQFYNYSQNGIYKTTRNERILDFVKMTGIKILYILYIIVLPITYCGYGTGLIIGCFFLMHAIGGFFLSTVFQLAHVVEGAEFPLPNDKGEIETEWAIHQMQTTADFGHESKFLTWFTGGLTHQVEHHLFPDICHIHYTKIAPIVKQTAEEFGVPYHYNPSYWSALKSHVVILKKFGLPDDFNIANA